MKTWDRKCSMLSRTFRILFQELTLQTFQLFHWGTYLLLNPSATHWLLNHPQASSRPSHHRDPICKWFKVLLFSLKAVHCWSLLCLLWSLPATLSVKYQCHSLYLKASLGNHSSKLTSPKCTSHPGDLLICHRCCRVKHQCPKQEVDLLACPAFCKVKTMWTSQE